MRWFAGAALLMALCALSLSALAQPPTEAEDPGEPAEGPQSIGNLDPAVIEKAYGIACEAAGMELDPEPRWMRGFELPHLILFGTPRDIVPRESFQVDTRTWSLSMHGRRVMANPPPPTVEEVLRLVRAEVIRFLPEDLASAMHFRIQLWAGDLAIVIGDIPGSGLPPVTPVAPCHALVTPDARAVSWFSMPFPVDRTQEDPSIPFPEAVGNVCERLGAEPADIRVYVDPIGGEGTHFRHGGEFFHWSITFETSDLNGRAEVDARTGEVTYIHTHPGPASLGPLDTEIAGEGHPRSTGWYYFDEAGDMFRAEDPKWYRLDAEGNLVPIPDEERAEPADEAPEIEVVPDEEEILG